MAKSKKNGANKDKRVTRYTYDELKEPRTPETGHTALLPGDEQVVSVQMDNGWSKAINVGKLPRGDDRPVVVDLDPAADAVLFWAGKRSRRKVPILPLQRNEIVSASRIAQMMDRAQKAAAEKAPQMTMGSIFADLEKTFRESDKSKRVEFYTHDEGWKNKLICGDSLHVIESLLNYEGLRSKVQMIYMDPPYGIAYNSNFQQRVDSVKNDEADKADDVLTIKAFRDTWTLGIHTYLSHLQERLYLCRELLTESGSVFVQIGDANLHLVRALLDEVFGRANFCSLITYKTTTGQSASLIPSVSDYLIWYAKSKPTVKYRKLYTERDLSEEMDAEFKHYEMPDGTVHRVTPDLIKAPSKLPNKARLFRSNSAVSGEYSEKLTIELDFGGIKKHPGDNRHWKTSPDGMMRLFEIGRLLLDKGPTRMFKQYLDDYPIIERVNNWNDLRGEQNRIYSTQTHERVVSRCLLMTTDPGDLIFDPTCGSGTTAYCAEEWGRRWVTCDNSRVSINVARKRFLSSVFDHYVTRNGKVSGNFAYKTVVRRTLESLAKDLEPEKVELVDKPEIDRSVTRVIGPFEVMSLGRYSLEDWQGYTISQTGTEIEPLKLVNYVEVIARLYRREAAIQGSNGVIHAIAESNEQKIAISVGPLSGRVTAKQVNDAVQDSLSSGILEVHILGWAFEANVGEVKAQLEKRGKVRIELIMIRPDTLAEGLKTSKPEALFSPLALPDIEVELAKSEGQNVVVRLKGVALFDRKTRTTDYKRSDSGYISAWYLDEDYDGDCFVDCQMFFDFIKEPNLKALGLYVEPGEYRLQVESRPFPLRTYKRIAVKVVDVFGNESAIVREL